MHLSCIQQPSYEFKLFVFESNVIILFACPKTLYYMRNRITWRSRSTFDRGLLVRNTCSITGSVCKADLPNPELSVGTVRHQRTVWPRDSATCMCNIITWTNAIKCQITITSRMKSIIYSIWLLYLFWKMSNISKTLMKRYHIQTPTYSHNP